MGSPLLALEELFSCVVLFLHIKILSPCSLALQASNLYEPVSSWRCKIVSAYLMNLLQRSKENNKWGNAFQTNILGECRWWVLTLYVIHTYFPEFSRGQTGGLWTWSSVLLLIYTIETQALPWHLLHWKDLCMWDPWGDGYFEGQSPLQEEDRHRTPKKYVTANSCSW